MFKKKLYKLLFLPIFIFCNSVLPVANSTTLGMSPSINQSKSASTDLKISVTFNDCTKKTTEIKCVIGITPNKPVDDFGWTSYCGHHADGGGAPTSFGFEIYLIGPKTTCDMTVWAANPFPGEFTSLKLKIFIPGNYPGTWEDYCEPWGTCPI